MTRRAVASVGVSVLLLAAVAAPAPAVAQESVELRVLSFNVWHGLRSGESKKRFPGEGAERKERRFEWQIEEIRRLDPDVLLFQEVNPNQREARKYARALGYDEIHKVTSCGIHLGKLYKLPRNVNEGLAILAKPELRLRRLGWKRLSGNAWCTASFGIQTRESRFALFGAIEVRGRPVLVVTTHLFSPAFMPPGFREGLDRLVGAGTLTAAQRREIVDILDARLARHVREVRDLDREIERRRRRLSRGDSPVPVVLGGDFNAEPGTSGLAVLLEEGYVSATGDREVITWDPVVNEVNYGIGTRQSDPVPTFGIPELVDLLAPRRTIARQIDHLFVAPVPSAVAAERVLDQARDGIFPSDHYGVLATVELAVE